LIAARKKFEERIERETEALDDLHWRYYAFPYVTAYELHPTIRDPMVIDPITKFLKTRVHAALTPKPLTQMVSCTLFFYFF
jgi:hypothetical protein